MAVYGREDFLVREEEMQFNSFIFILLLLPITVIAYFCINIVGLTAGKLVIIIASIIFYAYPNWTNFRVLGISLLINFGAVWLIIKCKKNKKIFILAPILINIGLLLYFKYTNFFIITANRFTGNEWTLKELVQPLGISFFTFQQIAYVVAIYDKEIEKISLIDYLAYILYFPKILMGPLMEPADFVNQINDQNKKRIDWDNIACGIRIFSLGLFKKVMLADIYARGVTWGFSNFDNATAMDWILVTLFYTFEIYFDFSGYSDMAVGASQMLNITLPINFDSPYKALSVRDFWKRWHISLTKFFTKYVYIPLGGSRKGKTITYVNTLIVFLISGFWHGANWTFILWGVLHGFFMIFDRIFEKNKEKVFEPVRWLLTFCTINVLWLLFRADSIGQWKSIINRVLLMQDTTVSYGLIDCFTLQEADFLVDILHLKLSSMIRGFWLYIYAITGLGICLIPENNYRNVKQLSISMIVISAVAFVWGVICLSSESVFVYFNF